MSSNVFLVNTPDTPTRYLRQIYSALPADFLLRIANRHDRLAKAPRSPATLGLVSPFRTNIRGAGHYIKMVHNGIEYQLMAAYAQGLNVLKHSDAGDHQRDSDAETTPPDDPDSYRNDFDLPAVAEVWRRGSVIRYWLLDLTDSALQCSSELDEKSD